jgi:hypothetical protein
MFRPLVFTLLFSAATVVGATTENTQLALADGGFAQQKARIEAELADGKTYAEISAQDQATVRESLARIADTLETAGSMEALSGADKVEVFNDQEVVNTILTQAAYDSRQVCERIESTGSHRKTTVCTTVAERNRRRELDQSRLRTSQGRTPVLGGE